MNPLVYEAKSLKINFVGIILFIMSHISADSGYFSGFSVCFRYRKRTGP